MTQWGIDALFNPGKRHMDEEKRRLQSTRQEIGDSSGGKRIDLNSGKVTLKGKQKPDDDAAADDTLDDADPGHDAAEVPSSASESESVAESTEGN